MDNCTCDITDLMKHGCRCGWIEIERAAAASEQAVDEPIPVQADSPDEVDYLVCGGE